MEEVLHPELGLLLPYDQDQLLGSIDVPSAIRAARLNGQTDAEILIKIDPCRDLADLVADAAARVRAGLADLERIKDYALAHAPADWREHYEQDDRVSLRDRLFFEGFTISTLMTEVLFDFGDLDLLVVELDPVGNGRRTYLA